MSTVETAELPLHAEDGHAWTLSARIPAQPRRSLLWLPAMGVAARHYLPLAEALAARGVAVFLHEWRGNGSSNLRADRRHDWGYRELLLHDIPASAAAATARLPDMPQAIGGHSLGGQLACCRLALAPQSADALWLVASGAPYWRAFPPSTRWWLPMAYRFLPWIAGVRGALPGHRLGFGGNEARSLVRDWSRTAFSGRYAAEGIDADLEAGMSPLRLPVRAVLFDDDWLAPPASLRFLLSKLPHSGACIRTLDARALHARADHFSWMKHPAPVAGALADQADAAPAPAVQAASDP